MRLAFLALGVGVRRSCRDAARPHNAQSGILVRDELGSHIFNVPLLGYLVLHRGLSPSSILLLLNFAKSCVEWDVLHCYLNCLD